MLQIIGYCHIGTLLGLMLNLNFDCGDVRGELGFIVARARTRIAAIRSTAQSVIVFPTRYHPAANLYRARLNAVSTVQVVDTIIHDKSPAESLA